MIDTHLDSDLEGLLKTIEGQMGLDCGAYKESCLRRRIAVRMRACDVRTYTDYAAVLVRTPDEYDRLLSALTINVTKFYRNRDTWEALAERVLPILWQARKGNVRCWSAGCSTGEEPYTMTILLLELARKDGAGFSHGGRVDATDLDPESLAKAEQGSYKETALEEMPPDLVDRYFSRDRPRSVLQSVRQNVEFSRHDITVELPPNPSYDIIVCRNVLIYFDRSTQERIFRQFVHSLASGGYLVLGKTETLFGNVRETLELVDARERIYKLP